MTSRLPRSTGRNPDPTTTATLVLAFTLAATASVALWSAAIAGGERIDLESVIPLIGDTVIGPGSGGSTHSGAAGLVLLTVAVVAGLPLLVPAGIRRRVTRAAAVAVSIFAVATLFRNGLFYLPAAGLLWRAVGRSCAASHSGLSPQRR